jgi:hypothetical protein
LGISEGDEGGLAMCRRWSLDEQKRGRTGVCTLCLACHAGWGLAGRGGQRRDGVSVRRMDAEERYVSREWRARRVWSV